MKKNQLFDPELIRRYDHSGPRYTSYPTAVQFHQGFTVEEYQNIAQESNLSHKPLSLYLHIPFCDTACFYCACNKTATKDRSLAQHYLTQVATELAEQSRLFDSDRPVVQLHWGGGTPTFLNHDEMRHLMATIRSFFTLAGDQEGEFGIEIDPRKVTHETVELLRELGFNRMSLGVQDFDPQVQAAVNRHQSEEETTRVIEAARRYGFHSISVDLIYGLPFQNQQRFLVTLEKLLSLNPDRFSIFNYAHLPDLFPTQRRIRAEDLPPPEEKLAILGASVERLIQAGYLYIGMDHFAKPEDELAQAQRNHTLYRNFQGYSTHADCDLIGVGSTAISQVNHCYAQNSKTLESYQQAIQTRGLAIFRGITLTAEDRLRREVITRLICHFTLSFPTIEANYGINFHDHFQSVFPALHTMEEDGLLQVTDHSLEILPAGRFLIRNICMLFDQYLKQNPTQHFSKVI